MRKQHLITILLTIFLLAAVIMAASADNTVLTYPVNEIGGPEYSVFIKDPSVISCSSEIQYDEKTDEPFKEVFSIAGLKPGETDMTISARSQLLENFDAEYKVTVDEQLNVNLTTDRKLASLRLSRSPMTMSRVYEIYLAGDKYTLYIDNTMMFEPDPQTVPMLTQIIDERNLFTWDGFDDSDPYILDGESFSFRAVFTNGDCIRATGNNAFPKDYYPSTTDMEMLLENAATGNPIPFSGTYVLEEETNGNSFMIKLFEGGSYSVCESGENCPGSGEWYQEGHILTLLEESRPILWNNFIIGNGELIFVETESDNFPYSPLKDMAKLILQEK